MCSSSWEELTATWMTWHKRRCCLLSLQKPSPPNLQVDLEASVVDTELKQMTVRYKDGGIIEELLGQ